MIGKTGAERCLFPNERNEMAVPPGGGADTVLIHRGRRKEGRTEDALASGGEEGRGKLRKSTGIGKHELIRAYPNGATRRAGGPSPS